MIQLVLDLEDLAIASGITMQILEMIDKSVSLDGRSFVLEAGCGSGKFGINLAVRHGCHVTLVDNDQEALLRATRLCWAVEGLRGLDIPVTLREGDVLHLPFDDDTFHLVFNEGVIEHFTDPTLPLKEMVRVSRKNVIIIVPNFENAKQKLLAKRQTEAYAGKEHWAAYEQPMTGEQLEGYMKSVGLEVDRIVYVWPEAELPKLERQHFRMILGAGTK